MAVSNTLVVGTIGYGVFRTENDGKDWERSNFVSGLPFGTRVYYLVSHPHKPEVIFAGTDFGLARSDDGGRQWKIGENALSNYSVWALAIDQEEPDVMFAGTSQGFMFRSMDGGNTWEKRPVEVAEECVNVGIPRTTSVAIDPTNRNNIWMGIEVDGMRRSVDRGDTWTKVDLKNLDGHDIKISAGEPHTVLIMTNSDLYTSTDDGTTWKETNAKDSFPYTFCRNMAVQPGHPQNIFLTHGDGAPGTTGMLLRSKDSGNTWDTISLTPEPNSSLWTVAVHEADPNLMYTNSVFGYIYRSDDGGESWDKLSRELSEIRSMIWVPN
ncbi:MAG: hypothetical protein BZY88_16385 [SAR202 cluster bacterium Io17-Chloro-G9]|nr:MAG: hypothetical protein BZY88_16385 [SAR202 cluster bacterium Io17-Chloro-G9]